MHAQKGQVFDWTPLPLYPLEVCHFLLCLSYLLSSLINHHRQTVFYTPTTLTVDQGDTITGRLTCAPNAKNNRDLDIIISYSNGKDAHTVQYKMYVPLPFRLFLSLSPTASASFVPPGLLTACQVLIGLGHDVAVAVLLSFFRVPRLINLRLPQVLMGSTHLLLVSHPVRVSSSYA